MSALGYMAASVPPRLAIAGSVIAIPVLAVQELGDVGLGGALVAASLGPSVLAAPFAGVTLDRARRPGILIAVSGLFTAAALAVASSLGDIPLPAAFACLAVAGAVSPFYLGGFSSFVADEIPDKRRAFGYDALSYNVSAVVGPALVAGIVMLFAAEAALLVLSGIAVFGAMIVSTIGLTSRGTARTSAWRTIAAGLHRIFSHRPLAVVTAASTLSQLGQGGLAVAAVALSVERVGSPGQGALLVTAFGVGGLVGALSEALHPTRIRPDAAMVLGFLATGLLTICAAFDLGTAWAVVTVGLSGVFTAFSATAMLFLRNHLSPPHLRSQVFTVSAGFRASASAAGAALAGSATALNAELPIVGIGLIWLASAAVMSAYPRVPRDRYSN